MILTKKYIRNLDLYLGESYQNKHLIFGYKIDNLTTPLIKRLGFASIPSVGDSLLPAAVGPYSFFNANGKIIVHRDQPKVSDSREIYWTRKEWRGRHDTEEISDIRDIQYMRYPRTFLPPPSIELKIERLASGQLAIVSPTITLTTENHTQVMHVINLILEICEFCEVFDGSLDEIANSPLRRLNWRILPPGVFPWPRLREQISDIIERTGKNKQKVLEFRFQTLNSYAPDFHAVGQGGFRGYIVFGFPTKHIFCLESMFSGNATYVFAENWEILSKRTKAEILNEQLQSDRLIHRQGWPTRVRTLLV